MKTLEDIKKINQAGEENREKTTRHGTENGRVQKGKETILGLD